MIRHKRLSPPGGDYPADEWNVIEKEFRPDFLAQLETVLALGNGYIGMRGCPEEGGPSAENSTLINGFYETWPIVYAEDAYGFAKTGQTILNVTDSKTIKLFVDDEPFWLSHAHLLKYDRRLNMKSGTLDREVNWQTPAGKQVHITFRKWSYGGTLSPHVTRADCRPVRRLDRVHRPGLRRDGRAPEYRGDSSASAASMWKYRCKS
jgi:alpha,alpha-trehalose phosphorylase